MLILGIVIGVFIALPIAGMCAVSKCGDCSSEFHEQFIKKCADCRKDISNVE